MTQRDALLRRLHIMRLEAAHEIARLNALPSFLPEWRSLPKEEAEREMAGLHRENARSYFSVSAHLAEIDGEIKRLTS
ncbi:MAG TPA: hypothetical protein VGV41_12455 [Pseudolabrys sp.]|uniref:hypothetical protein n=1 Tax=Pseudolabrys sp. TaxID=1960880 RepID=UPI002DDD1FEF|nr:hypothetical protein [Pseudolabrys sp.]HEV2629442.1 hypothetical protein [Pseudolabrys sp.]